MLSTLNKRQSFESSSKPEIFLTFCFQPLQGSLSLAEVPILEAPPKWTQWPSLPSITCLPTVKIHFTARNKGHPPRPGRLFIVFLANLIWALSHTTVYLVFGGSSNILKISFINSWNHSQLISIPHFPAKRILNYRFLKDFRAHGHVILCSAC